MSRSQVAIAKDGDPVEMVKSTLELAGIGELCRGKEVLIKINLSGGAADQKGANVSEPTARGVLEYLKPFCKRLALGDGARFSADVTRKVLEQRTFAKSLTDELGVELINLWETGIVTAKVPKPVARAEWPVAKVVLDFEMVGSLSVLKVNGLCTITVGMKNLYGVLAIQKLHELHPWVQEIVVDLTQIVKPAFGIIDGFWGWEGGESSRGLGSAIQANMVLASQDIVALDAVGAMVIGRDPTQIRKLRLAHEVGLGTFDPEQIEILGVPVEKARMMFRGIPAESRAVFSKEVLDAGVDAMLASL